jgi:hypothetical protein
VTVPTAAVAGSALSYGSYSEDGTVVEVDDDDDDEVAEKSEGASVVDVEPIAADESSLGPADVEQLEMAPSRHSDRATRSRGFLAIGNIRPVGEIASVSKSGMVISRTLIATVCPTPTREQGQQVPRDT